jgi:hypothetical protein
MSGDGLPWPTRLAAQASTGRLRHPRLAHGFFNNLLVLFLAALGKRVYGWPRTQFDQAPPAIRGR